MGLIALLNLAVLGIGFASGQCPSPFAPVSTHCMYCAPGTADWNNAVAACRALGGNLGAILNQAQENFAEQCGGFGGSSTTDVYIGLMEGDSSRYVWLDGSVFGFIAGTHAITGNSACIAIEAVDTWDEATCGALNKYVCSRPFVRCPKLDDPSFSSSEYSSAAVYVNGVLHYNLFTQATFTCAEGYTPASGSSTRQCTVESTWTGTPLVCSAVQCDPLTAPGNGSVLAAGSGSEATTFYLCNSGFTLSGASVRICQSNGQWNGTASTCVADPVVEEVAEENIVEVIGLGMTAAVLGAVAFVSTILACVFSQCPAVPQPPPYSPPQFGAPFRPPIMPAPMMRF